MQNVNQTILSQFANSPVITGLIENMNQYFDPSVNFDQFYNYIWNIQTAQGFGLDILGRIVNIPRTIKVTPNVQYFGFQDGSSDYYPFNQAPFYIKGAPLGTATYTYSLADADYRNLILAKAFSNISDTSIPSLNTMLRTLFPNRGVVYVIKTGTMALTYQFNFYLQPVEIAIIDQGLLLTPAGVSITLNITPVPLVFGFQEAGAQTFGEGTFNS